MAAHTPRHHPVGSSKTALRRGHLTTGHPAARKTLGNLSGKATTSAEEAFLFDDPSLPKAAETLSPKRVG